MNQVEVVSVEASKIQVTYFCPEVQHNVTVVLKRDSLMVGLRDRKGIMARAVFANAICPCCGIEHEVQLD